MESYGERIRGGQHLARLPRGLARVLRALAESFEGIDSIVCTFGANSQSGESSGDSIGNYLRYLGLKRVQPPQHRHPSHHCAVAFLSPCLEHSRRGGSWRRLWFVSSGRFVPFAFHFVHSTDGLVCFKFRALSILSYIGISKTEWYYFVNGIDGRALATKDASSQTHTQPTTRESLLDEVAVKQHTAQLYVVAPYTLLRKGYAQAVFGQKRAR